MQRVAVVTGGNRGLGLEICRQLALAGDRVVLTARDPAKGEAAAIRLAMQGLTVETAQLDVADPASCEAFAQEIRRRFGRVDRLVNNAGVLLDHGPLASALTVPRDILEKTMEVNVYAPVRLCQLLVPMMRAGNYGRIVNVSSGMGALNDMGGGWPAYRLSKAALNAATRVLAAELGPAQVKVNAACPGWVRTDMGGEHAPRSVQEGADTPVWLATLPDDGPTGGFFRDRQPIPW